MCVYVYFRCCYTVYVCQHYLLCLPQNDGRLRFGRQSVVYKSSKTGKVDSIPAAELSQAQWRRVCLGQGIKLTTSTGHIYKYDGFRDTVTRGMGGRERDEGRDEGRGEVRRGKGWRRGK